MKFLIIPYTETDNVYHSDEHRHMGFTAGLMFMHKIYAAEEQYICERHKKPEMYFPGNDQTGDILGERKGSRQEDFPAGIGAAQCIGLKVFVFGYPR